MLCAPPDTLARLKWKGREVGAEKWENGGQRRIYGAGMGAIASQKSGKKF